MHASSIQCYTQKTNNSYTETAYKNAVELVFISALSTTIEVPSSSIIVKGSQVKLYLYRTSSQQHYLMTPMLGVMWSRSRTHSFLINSLIIHLQRPNVPLWTSAWWQWWGEKKCLLDGRNFRAGPSSRWVRQREGERQTVDAHTKILCVSHRLSELLWRRQLFCVCVYSQNTCICMPCCCLQFPFFLTHTHSSANMALNDIAPTRWTYKLKTSRQALNERLSRRQREHSSKNRKWIAMCMNVWETLNLNE